MNDDTVAMDATFIGCLRGRGTSPKAIIEEFRRNGYTAQPVNADMVFGVDHLRSAYLHALRRFSRGRGLSDDFGTELLSCAACERQISKSIRKMKVPDDGERIAIIITPAADNDRLCSILSKLHLVRDDTLMEVNAPKVRNASEFGIEESEVSQLTDAILEKIAILDLSI
jgi:KEOPS complex subunit Cgi121